MLTLRHAKGLKSGRKGCHEHLLNILMISLLSLLTMVFSFLSQSTGTVYLPAVFRHDLKTCAKDCA